MIPIQIEVPAALAAELQRSGQPIPPPVPGNALIDTGATISAIHEPIAQHLGVNVVNVIPVGTPGGQTARPTYPARFVFPGTGLPTFEFSQVLGADLTGQQLPGLQAPLVALVGRDLLERFVLIYHGPYGMFTLAF